MDRKMDPWVQSMLATCKDQTRLGATLCRKEAADSAYCTRRSASREAAPLPPRPLHVSRQYTTISRRSRYDVTLWAKAYTSVSKHTRRQGLQTPAACNASTPPSIFLPQAHPTQTSDLVLTGVYSPTRKTDEGATVPSVPAKSWVEKRSQLNTEEHWLSRSTTSLAQAFSSPSLAGTGTSNPTKLASLQRPESSATGSCAFDRLHTCGPFSRRSWKLACIACYPFSVLLEAALSLFSFADLVRFHV